MLIIDIVVIIITVAILAVIINGIEDYNRKQHSITFKGGIDTTSLPIVTLCNNKQKLNFLVDTGSDDSYLSRAIISKLEVKDRVAVDRSITGAAGNVMSSERVTLDLSLNQKKFALCAYTLDFDGMFSGGRLRNTPIHGILGSTFFKYHSWCIDYKNFVIYYNYGKSNKVR